MTNERLKCFLMSEAEYTEVEVDDMTPIEMLSAWLEYQGICGYTIEILEVAYAAGVDLEGFGRMISSDDDDDDDDED